MKRKISSIIIAMVLVLTMCMFVGCNSKAVTPNTYNVSVIGGTGGGIITSGKETTVIADVPSGYDFVSWKVNGEDVSKTATYTFKPTVDIVIVAATAKSVDPVEETVTVSVIGGTGGGTVTKGSQITVKSNPPQEDFLFLGWKVGTTIVSSEANYTFAANADITVTAEYEYTYEMYTGKVPTEKPDSYVDDAVNRVLNINDAEAFAWWRSLIFSNTGGYTQTWFGIDGAATPGYTININCNLDMAGVDWDPIDAECGIFNRCIIDFKGHSIKNMYTEGKPAATNETSYRGWPSGGFFTLIAGETDLIIKNLTFKNATVVGTAGQLGVLTGGIYNANVTIENVHVIDSVVDTSTGHKVGGLIGRVGNHESYGDQEVLTIKDTSVSGTTVAGMRNASGLIGVIFSARATFVATKWSALGANCNEEFFINTLTGFKNDLKTFKEQLAALEAADPKDQAAIDAKKAEVLDRETKIEQYTGFIAEFDAHTINLTLDNITVADCYIYTRATTYPNASAIYNFSKAYYVPSGGNVASGFVKGYDNTKGFTFNHTTPSGISYGNTIINTKTNAATDVGANGVAKNPLYPVTAESLTPMFTDYAMDDSETNGYDVCTIYVNVDLDFTQMFEVNEWDEIRLPATVKFYLLGGAKITGIPENVLNKAHIAEWKPVVEIG